jgi:hypothetical protein
MAKEYYSLAFEDLPAEEGHPAERAEDALVSYMNETGDEPLFVCYKDGAIVAFFAQEQ